MKFDCCINGEILIMHFGEDTIIAFYVEYHYCITGKIPLLCLSIISLLYLGKIPLLHYR